MVNITEAYAAMPSQKHSGRRPRTQMLVVHSAECPLRRGYAKSLTNWSNTSNVQASWNAFVDPGVLVRAVNTYYAAWHASWANSLTVGYETAAYAAFSRAEWMTLEGRRMLERLAIEMAADAEIFDIPLRWLTGAQVNAIRAGNITIKGLSTHRQVDPAYRTDPGDGFPYGYLLKRIKAHTNGTAAQAPKPAQKEWYEMALDHEAENDIERIVERAIEKKAGHAVWSFPVNKTSPEGEPKTFQARTYLSVNNERISATWDTVPDLVKQNAALSAAVTELAKNTQITPDQLQAALDKAVGELKLTFTPDMSDQ